MLRMHLVYSIILLGGLGCCHGSGKFLLVVQRTKMLQISLDEANTTTVLPIDDIDNAISVDFDPTTSYMYWTDESSNQRAYLNGSNHEVIAQTKTSEGIAVDWIAQNVYWTDTGTNTIEVARVDGTSRKVLINEKLDEPRAICLDPANGYMYWSDWGLSLIARAYLDGTNGETLFSSGIKWPNALAIDVTEQRIYWGDAKLKKIESAYVYGADRKVILAGRTQHIFGMSVLDQYIYWTDWQTREINRINKWTGEGFTTIRQETPDLMGLKATSLAKPNTFANSCGKDNGNCSHLCLFRPLPLDQVCACPQGLFLLEDGRTCGSTAYLLYSSNGKLQRRSVLTNNTIETLPVPNTEEAFGFDYVDNFIFWVDKDLRQISRADTRDWSVKHIITFGLLKPRSIAVDWIAGNIYWADSGKNVIEVARLDGSSRKVVVGRNLEHPRALAVDPPSGYMYWSCWGPKPVLERANLDGTNRLVLIDNPGHVQDLAIDYVDKRLYWADVLDDSIKTSDMLGGDIRTVVQTKLQRPMGLSQFEGFVYWTNPSQGTIERASKLDGSNRAVVQSGLKAVKDVQIIPSSRHEGTNTCGVNNGGCSDLCFAHPLDDPQSNTHHCACPSQSKLNSDRFTCKAHENYLLYSARNYTTRIVIGDGHEVDTPDVVLPIGNMKDIKALDYDPVDEFIYWVVGNRRIIKRAHANGTMMSTLVVAERESFEPFDIAIDPYGRTIYWTCTNCNTINVSRIDTLTLVGSVLSRQDFAPRSLALYPEKGKLFYTNMYGSPTIETALMDGSDAKVLFSTDIKSPQALTIDSEGHRLYWADSILNRIESADIVFGGGRKVLVDGLAGNPTGLAVYGDLLYWLNKKEKSIERIDKKTGDKRQQVRSDLRGISDLIAVTPSQSYSSHPCYPENSPGCSHLCFSEHGLDRESEARCGCPLHLRLGRDKKTCEEPPSCGSDEFACRSGSIGCIPKEWRCDFQPECEDSSDEEGCDECKEGDPYCSTEGQQPTTEAAVDESISATSTVPRSTSDSGQHQTGRENDYLQLVNDVNDKLDQWEDRFESLEREIKAIKGYIVADGNNSKGGFKEVKDELMEVKGQVVENRENIDTGLKEIKDELGEVNKNIAANRVKLYAKDDLQEIKKELKKIRAELRKVKRTKRPKQKNSKRKRSPQK